MQAHSNYIRDSPINDAHLKFENPISATRISSNSMTGIPCIQDATTF